MSYFNNASSLFTAFIAAFHVVNAPSVHAQSIIQAPDFGGLCLDIANPEGKEPQKGAQVIAWPCHSGPNQRFVLNSNGTIQAPDFGGLCLNIANPEGKGPQNGAQVIAWPCHSDPNQRFVLNSNGTIQAPDFGGLCLDIANPEGNGPHNGAQVIAWPCHGSPNQRWNLDIYSSRLTVNSSGSFIVNIQSGKCLDVSGAPGNSNGARIQLSDCELSGLNPDNNSPSDQRWTFNLNGFIVNTLSGKCLDVSGAPGRSNGSIIQLSDCELSGLNPDNGSPTDQIWTMTDDGFIRNRLSGKCIDVAGRPGKKNWGSLQLWDCQLSGRDRDSGLPTDQTWRLE